MNTAPGTVSSGQDNSAVVVEAADDEEDCGEGVK